MFSPGGRHYLLHSPFLTNIQHLVLVAQSGLAIIDDFFDRVGTEKVQWEGPGNAFGGCLFGSGSGVACGSNGWDGGDHFVCFGLRGVKGKKKLRRVDVGVDYIVRVWVVDGWWGTGKREMFLIRCKIVTQCQLIWRLHIKYQLSKAVKWHGMTKRPRASPRTATVWRSKQTSHPPLTRSVREQFHRKGRKGILFESAVNSAVWSTSTWYVQHLQHSSYYLQQAMQKPNQQETNNYYTMTKLAAITFARHITVHAWLGFDHSSSFFSIAFL